MFGDAVPSSAPLSNAAISLRHTVAIVNDGAWKAIGLMPGAAGTVPLPDGLPSTARVAVSESGTAAAFYDATSGALSVVTGIASSSMAAQAVSLTALPGAITAMTAGDDGSLLLSSSIAGGGEALFWIGPDGSARQLSTLQTTASLLLWNHGATALVVDRAANQVFKIQDPGGNAAITLLASDADGVASPAGAALSADGRQLWIANAGKHTVLGIDIAGRTAVSVACGCEVTTLVPLADGSSFRLNELDSGPLWLLDATPGVDPRVLFVPALQPATASEEDAQ